jgi:hypothetical protein
MSKTKKLIDCIAYEKSTQHERKFAKNGLRKASRLSSEKELREHFAEWQREIDEQMELIILEAAYYRDQQEFEELEEDDESMEYEVPQSLCVLDEMSQFELVCSEGLYPDDMDYE